MIAQDGDANCDIQQENRLLLRAANTIKMNNFCDPFVAWLNVISGCSVKSALGDIMGDRFVERLVKEATRAEATPESQASGLCVVHNITVKGPLCRRGHNVFILSILTEATIAVTSTAVILNFKKEKLEEAKRVKS